MKIRRFTYAFILVIGAGILGCNTISSTLLQRSEDNCNWQRGPYSQGIPITLKVPTHIRVEVYEKQFIHKNGDEYKPVDMDVKIRRVDSEIIKTDQIFTVDPKRPAAGSLTTNVTLQDQYLKTIAYNAEDRTINDINEVLNDLTDGGILAPPEPGKTNEKEKAKAKQDADAERSKPFPDLIEIDSLVAAKVFDLADPNLEPSIKAFLDCHMNNCHSCETSAPKRLDCK